MKTTDGVMRELAIKVRAVIEDNIEYDGECIVWASRLDKDLEEVVSHSLAEARREWVEETIDIINKMETWHYTNASPLIFREDLKRLLTGDNPENECKVCHRTSDVVDMSKCPFCEHDQELIREGRAMSDFDTRRGI